MQVEFKTVSKYIYRKDKMFTRFKIFDFIEKMILYTIRQMHVSSSIIGVVVKISKI